jgi:hypothetical protein
VGPVRDRPGITKGKLCTANAKQLQRIATKIRTDRLTPANNSILKPGLLQSPKDSMKSLILDEQAGRTQACIFQSDEMGL